MSPRPAPRRTITLEAAADASGAEGLTRRSALQLMAASMALASGACSRPPNEQIHPYVDMPERGRGGLPAYYASAFVRDGYAYGVLVGTREGRPIKIEGNPAHPSSLGASDAFMQASILELWDPERSQSVWQRSVAAGGAAPAASASLQVATAAAAPSTWGAFATAWRQQATRLAAVQGQGLAILTPSFTSPSLGLQLRALLQRFPRARWHRDSPLPPSAGRAGARLAFGRECDWRFHFDRCRFVLSLAADPFSDGPGKLRHARDWATRRAGIGPGEAARAADLPRSLAIEIRPGLFGARADERIAMAPAAIERVVEALAAQLLTNSSAAPAADLSLPADRDAALTTRVAAALRAAGSSALVLAGGTLSQRTHAQVAAINVALGAVGHTLEPIAPLDALGDVVPGDLAGLVADMNEGGVDTLLVVGANPVYEAPGALAFADALRRVSFSAHLGLHRDETAQASTWHLPASHDYESWGDACGHDGTATIVQPAILPLYDTRSPLECLAFLASGEEHDGHALVQETWRRRASLPAPVVGAGSAAQPSPAGATAFDAWWHRTLRAGLVEGSAAPRLTLSPRTLPPPIVRAAEPDVLVAVFDADPSTDTGRFSNNGWLQELPRPFTAVTWGNAVHVGPKTAARLELASGDIVRIGAGGSVVEGPVWVWAEHAEGVVSLPLGYGRRAAGRVGDGVGFDANVLRPVDTAPQPVTLARTGRRQHFAVTQRRLDQQGRELARSVVAGAALPAKGARPSLYPRIEPGEHAWAMTVDLDSCIGCNACTIACQAENNIPVVGAEEVARGREMHWIRVDHYAGEGGAAGIFQPVPCMHCEDAPCEVVCPVGATVHDSDGLNVQVYNRCVGTRFCSNNCPYKVRRFNFLEHDDGGSEALKALRNPDVTVRQRGVMEKCTYCVQRLSRARIVAEESGTAIADGDVVTACQSACPTRAIHFGDLRDASSDVVRSKASPRHYAMLEELGTRPRTTYLARVVRAPNDSSGSSETPR